MNRWKELFPWLQQGAAAPGETQQKKEDPAAEEAGSKAGGQQVADLSRLQCLTAPHRKDPFGVKAPPFSYEAAELSLALAEMTYTLDITPWMAAGWQDFSFQIDDVLESDAQESGKISTPQDEAFQQLASLERMRRAQAALRARNPFAQVLAALRQRESSDTVKAVCMAHPLPGGKHLIAIGFMGTGKRFYDWFSNFRFTEEDGFHQGFYQLCRHFEKAADSIHFPRTAMQLGLKQLTLDDILGELARPDSRFRLWMAGHSQGGAVMQIFTHRLMKQRGVLPHLLCGWGFASPTAATAGLCKEPWEAPLWHIQNRDDLVPRIGAQMHLGRCVEMTPDDTFRASTYRFSTLPADEKCRAWLWPILKRIRDTADNLLHTTALVLCIVEEKGEDALNLLMDRGRTLPIMNWLYTFAGDRAQSAVRQLDEYLRRMYAEAAGQEMDSQRLNALKEEMRPHVAKTPLRRLLTVLAACLTQPHLLNNDDEPTQQTAYSQLVCKGAAWAQIYRWEQRAGSEVPVRRNAPTKGREAAGVHPAARLLQTRRKTQK